jgi:hypothetical protein
MVVAPSTSNTSSTTHMVVAPSTSNTSSTTHMVVAPSISPWFCLISAYATTGGCPQLLLNCPASACASTAGRTTLPCPAPCLDKDATGTPPATACFLPVVFFILPSAATAAALPLTPRRLSLPQSAPAPDVGAADGTVVMRWQTALMPDHCPCVHCGSVCVVWQR